MTDTYQLTLFDYAQLDSETRVVVQQKTSEIKERMRNAAQSIVEIGERLLDIKQRLGHGSFGAWLKAEFEWSQDTARNFMNVAERFGQNPKISEFAPSALYLLASPSTPDAARADALDRVDRGEKVTHTTAKQIVQTHKPAPKSVGVAAQGVASRPVVTLQPLPTPTRPIAEIPQLVIVGDQTVPTAAFTGADTDDTPELASVTTVDTTAYRHAVCALELAHQLATLCRERMDVLREQMDAAGFGHPTIDYLALQQAARLFIESPTFKTQVAFLVGHVTIAE